MDTWNQSNTFGKHSILVRRFSSVLCSCSLKYKYIILQIQIVKFFCNNNNHLYFRSYYFKRGKKEWQKWALLPFFLHLFLHWLFKTSTLTSKILWRQNCQHQSFEYSENYTNSWCKTHKALKTPRLSCEDCSLSPRCLDVIYSGDPERKHQSVSRPCFSREASHGVKVQDFVRVGHVLFNTNLLSDKRRPRWAKEFKEWAKILWFLFHGFVHENIITPAHSYKIY